MNTPKEKKDYCDAGDQKKVVEKMTDCDNKSKTDQENEECYTQVTEEDDPCLSS